MACNTWSADQYDVAYLNSISASGEAVGSTSNTWDNDLDTYWVDNAGSLAWIAPQFVNAVPITKLRLYYGNDYSLDFAPTELKFQVSSNGNFSGEEVDLLHATSLSWSADTWKEWEFENPYSEEDYRVLLLDSIHGSAAGLFQIEMFYCTDIAGDDLIVISESISFELEFTGELQNQESIALTESVKGVLEFTGDAGSHNDQIALSEYNDIFLDGMFYAEENIGVEENANAALSIEIDVAENIGVAEAVFFPIFVDNAEGVQVADAITAFNWSVWFAANKDKAISRYFLTLTGEADATTDFLIPTSNFQARKRTGNPTYISATIPGYNYAQEISDRANGEIIISIGYEIDGVVELEEEILRASLEEIRPDDGGINRAITLSGNKTQSFINQTATIENPIYRSIQSGNIVYRFAHIDPWINPGDTCIVGEDSFTVDYIIYMVNSYQTVMEIREG